MPVVCTFGPKDIQASVKRGEGERTALDKKDPLARAAKIAGGKAWQSPDGRIMAEFPIGHNHVRIPVEWPNRAAAEAGLQYITKLAKDEGLLTAAARRQEKLMRIDVPEELFDIHRAFPELNIDAHMYGEVDTPMSDPHRYIGTGRGAVAWGKLVQVRSGFKGMGETGTLISEMFDRATELKTRITGRIHGEGAPLLARLSDAEKSQWFDLRSAGRQAEMSPVMREFDEWFTARAQQALESGLKVGLDVPHIFDANTYVPHLHDMSLLQEGSKLERVVNSMIKKGLAPDRESALNQLEAQGFGTSRDRAIGKIMEGLRRNKADLGRTTDELRADATAVLDGILKKKAESRSRFLEHERVADLPPIKDPQKIMAAYFTDTAERLAHAEVFGTGYSKMRALIEKLPDARMRQFAEDILTLETQGPAERAHGVLRFIHNWQANKLSLSVLGNMSQSFNTAIRAGFRPLARTFLDLMKGDQKEMWRRAKEVGAFTDQLLDEFTQQGSGWLFESAKIGQSLPERMLDAVTRRSLSIFNEVEKANRAIAVRSGEHYFNSLFADLQANPRNPATLKRFKELGMDASKLLELDAADLDQMRGLAGRRLSDITQFSQRSMATRPAYASHPIGALLYQFKSFTINQAQFMVNEVLGSHKDNSRKLRALAVMTTAMPAYGAGMMLFKEAFLGGSFAGDQLKELSKDPGFVNYVKMGAVLAASQGFLGIASDLSMSALAGNEFAIRSFFVAPVLSSAVTAVSMAGSTVRGVYNADSYEFAKAIRSGAREFGGVGSAAVNAGETLGVIPEQRRGRRARSAGGYGGFSGYGS